MTVAGTRCSVRSPSEASSSRSASTRCSSPTAPRSRRTTRLAGATRRARLLRLRRGLIDARSTAPTSTVTGMQMRPAPAAALVLMTALAVSAVPTRRRPPRPRRHAIHPDQLRGIARSHPPASPRRPRSPPRPRSDRRRPRTRQQPRVDDDRGARDDRCTHDDRRTHHDDAPTTTDSEFIETRLLGRSVEGRSIMADRRGTEGGRVVLVIGVIHGDEQAGWPSSNDCDDARPRRHRPVARRLDEPRRRRRRRRHNANGVDLNRNFPYNWGPIAEPGAGSTPGRRGQRARDAGDGRVHRANCGPTSSSGTTRTCTASLPAGDVTARSGHGTPN